MAMWPFRRRGSRRRSRTTPIDGSDFEVPTRGRRDNPPPRAQTETAVAGPHARPSRGNRDGANKLQRRKRAYSFSPGRRDSLRVAKARKDPVPPLPPGHISAVADVGNQVVPAPSNDESMTRVPTLHHDNSNKRRGQPLPRKKSSKRRKEDHDREAEIKAMSLFMPIRPATDNWIAGRPTRKDSKRYRTGLNRSWDHPSSDISLPVPESIRSGMSSDSEHISWKVSTLDALAPRPTLRCATNTVYGPGSSGPTRSQSSKRRISEKGTIPESTLRAHKRIDELADDLDSSDLRELMERDKRRRERKREKEQERVERRLARRSERQRAEEAAAVKSGTPPPPNLERGVLGREISGPANDPTSAVITSSKRRSSSDSRRRRSKQSDRGEELESHRTSPAPLDEFHRTDSIPLERSATKISETAALPEPDVQPEEAPAPRSPSPRILSFIRSKKSRSRSPRSPTQERVELNAPSPVLGKPDDTESGSRRTSESRSSRPWMSLFKWGKNRRSSGPSSFSNTSRDSMLANSPQPPINYMPPRRPSSTVPKRTMSRFREDLPELPLSPPDSRVASPEADLPYADPLPIIPDDDVQMRYDTPTSEHRSQEVMRATPISWHRDEAQPSPAPHSMSLASIDSEASWLSGRINRKRASTGMRSSITHYPPQIVSGGSEGPASEHTDDDNIADDEYLNSVVPTHMHRKSTGEARPSSDEEETEPEAKWGAVGRTPVVHHRDTMRSREGILQSFDDEKEFGDVKEFGRESEAEDDEQSPVEPQRATSVKLGKGHVRNFSAGSAKLLEISPRASTEHKINTIERGTQ
ncbi:hypothetical protein F4809DRAFT_476464 [Biscogniauxia mediterranea]|nr:hypothetical protein F4809DRAFT_476464 [Biscogniauxia mediterranea]